MVRASSWRTRYRPNCNGNPKSTTRCCSKHSLRPARRASAVKRSPRSCFRTSSERREAVASRSTSTSRETMYGWPARSPLRGVHCLLSTVLRQPVRLPKSAATMPDGASHIDASHDDDLHDSAPHDSAPTDPHLPVRIVVLGDVFDDVIVPPASPIRTDTDTLASIGRHPGGSAANTAAWLGTLVAPVDFVGRTNMADTRR